MTLTSGTRRRWPLFVAAAGLVVVVALVVWLATSRGGDAGTASLPSGGPSTSETPTGASTTTRDLAAACAVARPVTST